MRKSISLLMILSGSLLVAVPSATAADTPDANCPGPAESSFQIEGSARAAQTFVALGSGKLVSASVVVDENPSGSPGGNYVVSVNTTTSSGFPTNTKLATAVIPDASVPSGQSTQTARFPSPATVVAGRRYALVVTRPAAQQFGLGIREGNDCPAGVAYLSFGQTAPWEGFGPDGFDVDLVFGVALADVDPPETRITQHPPKMDTVNAVSFKFRSDEPGSKFRCKIDKKPFRGCEPPKGYQLPNGRHVFKVKATDPSGNTDPTPAKFAFQILRG